MTNLVLGLASYLSYADVVIFLTAICVLGVWRSHHERLRDRQGW